MYICNNVYIKRLRFKGPLIYLPLVIDFQYVNYNIHITKYTTSIFRRNRVNSVSQYVFSFRPFHISCA